MLKLPTDIPGFIDPGHIAGLHRRRSAVFAQLVATLALVVAIVVAAAAVTMEIGEAGVPRSPQETEGRFAFTAAAVLVSGAAAGVLILIAGTHGNDDDMAGWLVKAPGRSGKGAR